MLFPPFDPTRSEHRRRRFRAIPVRTLVPNVITLLALCAGLTAIRFAACCLLVAMPAHSEILYARPDGDAISRDYRWGDEIVLDPIPFKSAIDIAKAANG